MAVQHGPAGAQHRGGGHPGAWWDGPQRQPQPRIETKQPTGSRSRTETEGTGRPPPELERPAPTTTAAAAEMATDRHPRSRRRRHGSTGRRTPSVDDEGGGGGGGDADADAPAGAPLLPSSTAAQILRAAADLRRARSRDGSAGGKARGPPPPPPPPPFGTTGARRRPSREAAAGYDDDDGGRATDGTTAGEANEGGGPRLETVDVLAPAGRLGLKVDNLPGRTASTSSSSSSAPAAVAVVRVREGSPLHGQVRRGDVILRVDGDDVRGLTPVQVSSEFSCETDRIGGFEFFIRGAESILFLGGGEGSARQTN